MATRACLFDDKFVMHPDGSFDNNMGDETWFEGCKESLKGVVTRLLLMMVLIHYMDLQ